MKPYRLPKGYLTFQAFNKHLEQMLMVTPRPIDVLGLPNVAQNLSWAYSKWAQGYPLYCVRDTLLEDMLKTDVGENLALFTDINLAIPSYTLFFPQGKVKAPSGKAFIDYLIINHEVLDLPEYKHVISWSGIDSSGGFFLAYKRIRRDGTLQRSHFGTEDKYEQEQSFVIRNIALQSILLLQFYPDEIQQEMTVFPGKEKGFNKIKIEPEFQLPRWLGKESKASQVSAHYKGSSSSKSTHFRRGHWRSQPCGKGRSEIKITWVRPAWVSGI